VAAGQCAAPLGDPAPDVAALLAHLRADGAEAERVATHVVVPSTRDTIVAELGLLRRGLVDAVCVGSAAEVRAIAATGDWPAGGEAQPLVVALGDETAAAAAEAVPDAEVLNLGARPAVAAIVAAMETHFGAGRLLF
jgi:uroporphyrinogen-III synthase